MGVRPRGWLLFPGEAPGATRAHHRGRPRRRGQVYLQVSCLLTLRVSSEKRPQRRLLSASRGGLCCKRLPAEQVAEALGARDAA